MFGHENNNVNEVRYMLYSSAQEKIDARMLLPCHDSMKHNTKSSILSSIHLEAVLKKHG